MSEKHMKNKNRIIIIGIAAVLLVALVVVYFAVFRKKGTVASTEITEQTNAELKAPNILSIIPITNTSLLVEWENVEQADGYQLYLMDDAIGSYRFIGDIHENRKLCLVEGDTFKFKVRSYYIFGNVRYISEFGEENKIENVTKFITGLEYEVLSENSILLKWNKVSEATGYQVYRCPKIDGEYVLLDAVKKNSRTCGALTEGKVYYFKVRSFFEDGDEITYGDFSVPIRAVASHYSVVTSEETK